MLFASDADDHNFVYQMVWNHILKGNDPPDPKFDSHVVIQFLNRIPSNCSRISFEEEYPC